MKKWMWAVLVLIVLGSPVKIRAAGTTYYFDCNGNDSNASNTQSTPWKTIGKANSINLVPGDSLLFKKGCTWTGTANTNYFIPKGSGDATNPITIGAYGTGNNPILRVDARGDIASPPSTQNTIFVTGNYFVIRDLKTETINPAHDQTCLQDDGTPAKIGFYSGINIQGDNNKVINFESSNQSLGVFLQDNSNHNLVSNIHVHDMDTFWRIYDPGGAMGAIGVNLHGSDNEVSYSLFDNNNANCTDTDGINHNYSAPFEVYNANRIYVHHNEAYGHRKHFEMGKAANLTSADNVLAYNLFVSDQPNARGPNIHDASNPFGPVDRTQIYNNTFVFTGANSQALIDSSGGIVKNNIFVAEGKAAFYGGQLTEANNLYFDYQATNDNTPDPQIQFSGSSQTNIASTSKKLDPKFTSFSTGDFRLSSSSPALDAGVKISSADNLLNLILATDLDIKSIGPNPDIGAYEFGISMIPGDANGDGRVNLADVFAILAHWGSILGGYINGDFNGDGKTNSLDFGVWLENFN